MCQGVKCLFLELFNPNQPIILMNCILFFFALDQILETMTGIQVRCIYKTDRLRITEFLK